MKSRFFSYFLILGLLAAFSAVARSQGPRYTEWSPIQPVTAVNTAGVNEMPGGISYDGLRLYFMRAGDIYVSHRADRYADWETPVALSAVNSLFVDTTPFESKDGHWLFFGSTRPGVGNSDIWVSYRQFVHDDTSWESPVNLAAVNTVGFENAPMLFEDDERGTVQLYFAACPGPGGTQPCADIYVSNLGPEGFEPPVRVDELASAALDGKPNVRRDGLEILFVSYRLGGGGMNLPGAIFASTRWSVDEPWSAPTAVLLNSAPGFPGDRWITTPALSRDATVLFVGANEVGSDNGDVYVSYRKKITGKSERQFLGSPWNPRIR